MLARVFARQVAAHDFALFLLAGVANLDLEHEAVHLCLRKGIGTFLLNRVLRGQYEEGLLQAEGLGTDRHLPLLHGFEQGTLHLGRGTVDFVGQDEIGKNRAFSDGKFVLRRVVDHRAQYIRRQQVGRELYAAEPRVNRLRQRLDGQRFRKTRQTLQQYMAPREQAQQQALYHALLPHDDLGCLRLQARDKRTVYVNLLIYRFNIN